MIHVVVNSAMRDENDLRTTIQMEDKKKQLLKVGLIMKPNLTMLTDKTEILL